MTKVLLYLKGTTIRKSERMDLVQAGIIPVEVDSFERVKLMELVPDTSNVILKSAMEAISEEKSHFVTAKFGHRLAEHLTEKPPKSNETAPSPVETPEAKA